MCMVGTPQCEDPEVLIDLLRRSPLLEELQRGELDRRELQDRLDVSRATVHRHTRLLTELSVIEKVDGRFRLTKPGTLLVDAITRFKREAGSALQLAPVLDLDGDEPMDVDIEAFAGATVTTAEQGDPYAPVSRFESLLRTTDELRFVGSEVALMDPCLETILQLMEDGVEITFIDRPSCTSYFFSEYPELSKESMGRANFTVLEHDGLPPYGVGLFTDRVAVSCYEQGSGTVRALIDTDAREAREWAESKFASFLREARPIAPEPLAE